MEIVNMMFCFDWILSEITSIINTTHFLIVSGCFVIFGTMIVFGMIFDHLIHWDKPHQQKRILVIILIPVILSITSFLGLQLDDNDGVSKTFFLILDSIRECSVGLGICMFLSLLYSYMHLNTNILSRREIRLLLSRNYISNVFPLTLLQEKYFYLTLNNFKYHKYWTWQFVVIRLVCSVLMILLQVHGMYPVWLSWAFLFILYASVSVAFFNVYAFYHAFIKDFALHMPTAKFFCIKGIVFICFCQGGVLKALVGMGIIKSSYDYLQNSFMILEMLFFTLFHWFAYNAFPYYGHVPILPIILPDYSQPKLAPIPILPKTATTPAPLKTLIATAPQNLSPPPAPLKTATMPGPPKTATTLTLPKLHKSHK